MHKRLPVIPQTFIGYQSCFYKCFINYLYSLTDYLKIFPPPSSNSPIIFLLNTCGDRKLARDGGLKISKYIFSNLIVSMHIYS